MKLSAQIALLVLLIPTLCFAAEDPKHIAHEAKSGTQALSPELRDLLSREMKALQNGMMSIIPAYISGNWAEIENTANKMKTSYILKQNLTEKLVKELQSKLPHEFVEKDQRFHYLAGMLEHAAKMEKPELINFYYSEMNRACVSCHSKFATHIFPALEPHNKGEHTH